MMDGESSCGSLVDLLCLRARLEGDRRAKSFLPATGGPAIHRTYSELHRAALSMAAHLASTAAPGDRALLLYPPGLEFTEAFFGCLYAGLVAVPAPPPDPRRLERTLPRVRSILEDCAAKLILTTEGTLPALRGAADKLPSLRQIPWIATDSLAVQEDPGESFEAPRIGPETLAYLQYTSGSTAAPKGVRSTHAHILRNCRYLEEGLGYDRDSVQLSWVPDFHDDGLIQGVVLSIYTGFLGLRMAPLAVARRPLSWLKAMTDHRATHSGGPNFVYEMAAQRIRPADREGLDLSSWRVAYNAAEPIRASTLETFQEAFGPVGFRRETFYPAFGMAETTLIVSAKPHGAAPLVIPFDTEALELSGQAREVPPSAKAKTLVGCGAPLGAARFEIVDPETQSRQPEGQVGELWISDPCVADGYWGQPEATAQTFKARLAGSDDGPFLRTGDLAFLHREQVFIAGRLKDLIILAGRNLYPQDVELAAEGAHQSLRRGCGAAFAVEAEGKERLVIAQEAREGLFAAQAAAEAAEARGAIRQAVAEALDAEIWEIVLIAPGTLPKTSSGKIQRQACRILYQEGRLEVPSPPVAEPVASNIGALSVAEIATWLRRRLAEHRGCREEEIDPRQPFSRLGLGSTALVGLVGELEEKIGEKLSETFFWQHPTLEAVAAALAPGGCDGAVEVASANERHRRASQERQPVAIVGIGCRFPGAGSPEAFWRLLRDGIDAVGEVPPDRWPVEEYYHPEPRRAGKMSSRWGGFLDGVDGFDPYFFGISPREAERMDPQQRLLLEVTWEALEDAGIPPQSLAGSATGVWVGIGMSDYSRWLFEDGALSDAYAGTGGALSIAANRLSFFLDLRGPSLAVDSACSASLVAVERACRSLWRGETDLALAGGVNLILAPEVTVNFSQAGFLAPDGRSKAFDARADGYVRSEGAGVVVLKPLSRAQADGDPIYAVVLGGAVNQDGRSNGLTAPNPQAQERLILTACRDAGVDPRAIRAVEAHGTGTALGDPIEAQALGAARGARRESEPPCSLGSVKTNLGHLETAAGIAGLIKMALCLRHRRLVPSLHFEEPNPRIDFDALGLSVQTQEAPWESDGGPRLAGVSSFGFGGTNAHVILREAPVSTQPEVLGDDPRREDLVVLSAQDPQALRQRARDLRAALASGDGSPKEGLLRDLSWTTARRRSHLDHRLAVVARDLPELEEALVAFEAGDELRDLARGQRPFDGASPIAFVFSGQGGQWPAMGQELYATEPVFREALEAAARALAPHVDGDPLAELLAPPDRSRLEEIDVVQPLLFALQVALAALWRSWGVEPAAVIGHSLGEVAAVVVAGALSLEDGAQIICHRSQLMRMTSGGGAMLAVEMEVLALTALLQALGGQVEIAVINGPDSVAVSGEVEAVETLRLALEEKGIFCRRVKVDVAAHGPLMEPLTEPLGLLLAGLTPKTGDLRIFSTVLGDEVDGKDLDGSYWQRNLRRPVRFAEAVEKALENGVQTFVELGPHPLLVRAVGRMGERAQKNLLAIGSLRREEGERRQMLRGLGALYCRGVEPRWPAVAPTTGRTVSLPTYPWQRQRYWLERRRSPLPSDHPLLGRRLDSARNSETLWQTTLEKDRVDFLSSHRVAGTMVLPGTAYLEMAVQAGGALADVEFRQPLWIGDEALEAGEVELQTTVFEEPEGRGRRFEIYSRSGDEAWVRNACGRCEPARPSRPVEALDISALQERLGAGTEAEDFYRDLATRGYDYGPQHRQVHRLWSGDREVLVELRSGLEKGLWTLHPALLDSAWQGLAAWFENVADGDLWLPARVGEFQASSMSGPPAWARIEASEVSISRITARVDLFDRDGRHLSRTEGLELRRSSLKPPVGLGSPGAASPASPDTASPDTASPDTASRGPSLYTVEWREAPSSRASELALEPERWMILEDQGGVGRALAEELQRRGHQAILFPAFPGGSPGGERTEGEAEAWGRAFKEAASGAGSPLRRVVTLRPCDGARGSLGDAASGDGDVPRAVERALGDLLDLLAAVDQEGGASAPRLWIVTAGAVAVGGETLSNPVGGAVRGLAGVLAHEHPELFGGLVDLESGVDPATAGPALWREIVGSAGAERGALRRGRRFVARLREASPGEVPTSDSGEPAFPLREEAGYLITGGFGALGLEVARWLAARGARHLALLGRRIPEDGSAPQDVLTELEAAGCKIYPLGADVADASALSAALEHYSGPPWRGVIHAAGRVGDASLRGTDGEHLAEVLAPKVAGGWNLHRCFEETPLDFFWLFSSAAGVLGNPGQGAYAAANAFLGALAEYRKSQDLPARAFHWGPWGEVGFVARQGAELRERLETQGFFLMETSAGLEALGRAAGSSLTQPLILAADWARLGRSGSPLSHSPLLQDLLPAVAPAPAVGAAESPMGVDMEEALRCSTRSERPRILEGYLRRRLGKVLKTPAHRFAAEVPLTAHGLDSLVAVEVRTALESELKISVPLAWLLQGESLTGLRDHLLKALEEASSSDLAPPEPAVSGVEAEDLLERLDDLPPEEVDRLLAQMEGQEVAL